MSTPLKPRMNHIYRARLDQAYRQGFPVSTAEHATSENYDAWYDCLLDAATAHSIFYHMKISLGRTWTINPGGERTEDRMLAALVKEWINTSKGFQKSLYALLTGVFRGESYAYCNGSKKVLNLLDLGPRIHWTLDRLVDIDRDRITKINGEEPGKVLLQYYSLSQKKNVYFSPADYKAMVYFNPTESESAFTFGRGLLDSFWWAFYSKKALEDQYLRVAERHGGGFYQIEVEQLKPDDPGDKDYKLSDLMDEYQDVIEYAREYNYIVTRKGDTFKIIDPSSAGADLLIRGIDYYDNVIRLICVGSDLPIQSGDKGSFALGQVQQDTVMYNALFSRGTLEEAINDVLIPLLIDQNKELVVELGLKDARLPFFSIPEERKEKNQKFNLEILVGANRDLRLPLVRSEVYEMLGLSMPTEGDDVIEPNELVSELQQTSLAPIIASLLQMQKRSA